MTKKRTNQEIIEEIERIKKDFLGKVDSLTLEYKKYVQKLVDEAKIKDINKNI